ncbi:MAG: hypothetical protein HY332_01395, partial [Chloroflexi bacterium]|nr:hypothetical protein [Chloroflexota bacterium]
MNDLASALHGATGVTREQCAAHLRAAHLRAALVAGNAARHPETGFPVFAFRLHQFIGRGHTVFATLEPEGQRTLGMDDQEFAPAAAKRTDAALRGDAGSVPVAVTGSVPGRETRRL